MRKRLAFAILAALLLLAPAAYYGYFAWERHEHFYHGLPTSYWEGIIRRWNDYDYTPPTIAATRPWDPTTWKPFCWLPYAANISRHLGLGDKPAILRGDRAAAPVLLDLSWSRDNRVASQSAVALLKCSAEGKRLDVSDGYAIRLVDAEKRYLVLVLDNGRCERSSFSDDSCCLVLMDDTGKYLDCVTCSIYCKLVPRFMTFSDVFHPEVLASQKGDGARFAFIYVPQPKWKNWGSHSINIHSNLWRFGWDQEKPANVRTAEWERQGLCRVAVCNGRFEVLWPPLAGRDSP
jgi:hypothetical protein